MLNCIIANCRIYYHYVTSFHSEVISLHYSFLCKHFVQTRLQLNNVYVHIRSCSNLLSKIILPLNKNYFIRSEGLLLNEKRIYFCSTYFLPKLTPFYLSQPPLSRNFSEVSQEVTPSFTPSHDSARFPTATRYPLSQPCCSS